MENTSKALIIAGAILVAILLISIGIIIINSMKKPIRQADKEADSQAVQIFNSQFQSYIGKNKTASQVSSLIGKIMGLYGSDSKHEITIWFTEKGESETTNGQMSMQSRINSSSTYTVKMGTNKDTTYGITSNTENGYFCWCRIIED